MARECCTADEAGPNISIDVLSAGQHLVVWTARCWVYEVRHPGTALPVVHETYCKLGAPMALVDACFFFTILTKKAYAPVWFGNPICRCEGGKRILEAEAQLVNCLASFQVGQPQFASWMLGQWMPSQSVLLALDPVRRWALALEEQRVHLDMIDIGTKEPQAGGDTRDLDRQISLVN